VPGHRCTYYNRPAGGALGFCLKDGDVCHVTKNRKKCVARLANTPPVLITLGAQRDLASAGDGAYQWPPRGG
jgi:hypothetical protein